MGRVQSSAKPFSTLSPAERKARRAKCVEYLRRAGSLPEAQSLAVAEGFRQNTSVWLGALGAFLSEREEQG